MRMEIPGRRKRGRPKKRWIDAIRKDVRDKEMVHERTQWHGSFKTAIP